MGFSVYHRSYLLWSPVIEVFRQPACLAACLSAWLLSAISQFFLPACRPACLPVVRGFARFLAEKKTQRNGSERVASLLYIVEYVLRTVARFVYLLGHLAVIIVYDCSNMSTSIGDHTFVRSDTVIPIIPAVRIPLPPEAFYDRNPPLRF